MEEEASTSIWRWLGAGVTAGLLLACSSAPVNAEQTQGQVEQAWRQITAVPTEDPVEQRTWSSAVEPCTESKRFKKAVKDELFKADKIIKKLPKESVAHKYAVISKEQIQARNKRIEKRYCGKLDGYPRMFVTLDPTIKGSLATPILGFFYIFGWIGWAGRTYLIATKDPMKEIFIDVPLALKCMTSSVAWPVQLWQAWVNGTLAVKEENLHRSFKGNNH
jgi:photosystem I subunit 3